ncbi:MAG: tRNA epoxyqueuosine(34) reductase QueG [Acidobacteriales bacterium]|nr:tRNA epoxyqueuosine(34) reductase QueG [Terriglobales bacterium]
MQDLVQLAQAHAKEAGFDLCGVTPVREFPQLAYFVQWVEEGQAGEMKYLESRNEHGELKRASLANAASWARSVIVCALNYNTDQPYSIEPAPSDRGWISRYAWFKDASQGKHTDYHDAVLRRLRDLEARITVAWPDPIRTWCYVDTGPVVERVLASHAGIGWMGKNTCIINEQLGSWLFLGVILTSVEIEHIPMPVADRCGSCTRCIEACPTDAIIAPYKLDARKCISYLTIEKRGEVPEDLRAGMGRQVFGCDICQDVCPWNGSVSEGHRAPATKAVEFQPRQELVDPSLEWLAQMSRDEFNQVFRGSPIKRAKYEGLRRNAAIAMGNSGEVRFIPLLEDMVKDGDPVMAAHARWALERLRAACS